MSPANKGDELPSKLPEQLTLYFTSPDERADRILCRVLETMSATPHETYPGVRAATVNASLLEQLSGAWLQELTTRDRQEIRCRVAVTPDQPSMAQLMRSITLEDLIAWIDGQWLNELLEQQRLVTFFQPIVYANAPSDVFAYECLIRGRDRDGRLIFPDRLYNAARATGLLQSLDQAARLTSIETAALRGLSTCVFINFNPNSITDTVRCLGSTLRAALTSGLEPDRFVFEVVESEELTDPDGLLEILQYCRDAGCRVALDDLGAGYSSLTLLTKLKPDFIKLDMGLIRDVDRDSYKSRVASKLLEMAKELNVGTVVEGVETLGEWHWARQHGADFAQGYLFARPHPEPPRPAAIESVHYSIALAATPLVSPGVATSESPAPEV